MNMTRRSTAAAVLVAGLALVAGACSSSDSAGGTTTTEKLATTTTEADGSTTESTVSDDDFDAAVNVLSEQVDATGGDTCGLLEVLSGMGSADLPDPSTPTQVEAAVSFVAQLYSGIADAAPAEYAAEGVAINKAITDFEAEAEQQNYDPEWFNSDDLDPFASAEASAALATFGKVATESCAAETTTTTAG